MQSEDKVCVRKAGVNECFDTAGFEQMVTEYRQTAFPEMKAQLPKREDYLHLEATGNFFVFAAFADGKIVGFVTLIKQYYPHSGAAFMMVESIFACKEYRRYGTGQKLIEAAKACAKQENALGLMLGAPYGSRLAEVYMHKFKPMNIVFWCEV